MFQPVVLAPEPESWFVKELELIDPNLRVVFGYERYLMNNWVVECHIPPDVYAKRYFAFLTSGEPRYIDQPIFDHDRPIYESTDPDDPDPPVVGYEQVGWRKFDMAPDWEWRKTIQNPDGSFKPLGMDDILDLKREYAWNRNHAYSRAKWEADQKAADEKKAAERKQKRVDIWMEAYDESITEVGARVTGKPLTSVFTE